MTVRRTQVILDLQNNRYIRGMASAATATRAFAKEVDSSENRMSGLVQTSLALGPALIPIAAAATPVVAGMSAEITAAAAAAGVLMLATKGLGEGLGALNDYQLEPTAENLATLRQEFEKIGPAGVDFIMYLDSLEPKLREIQQIARAGLLPGVEDGIDSLLTRFPQLKQIVAEVSTQMGQLAAEGGEQLAGPRFDDFFDYLETDAAPTLRDMARTIGNLFEGVANLIVQFDPMADDFSKGLLGMARDFAKWSRSLDDNQSFQDFLDYVERVSPKAMDTLGAVAVALLDIVEAAAPVGEVSLPIIEALAKTLSVIAESPAGPALITAAVGVSALGRAFALARASGAATLVGSLSSARKEGTALGKASDRLAGKLSGTGALAGGVGVLALSFTDLDEKVGLSNTAMGAMMGMVAGPWGAAIGAGIGLVKDLAAENDGLADSTKKLDAAMNGTDLSAYNESLAKHREEMEKTRDAQIDPGGAKFWFDQAMSAANPLNAVRNAKGLYDWVTDDMDETEQATEQFTENLKFNFQRLHNAVKFPEGGGFQSFSMSLKDLEDFASRAQPALKKMGISLDDLEHVKTEEEINRIARGIANYNRHADSMAGRSGAVGKALRQLDNPMINVADSAQILDSKLSNLFDPGLNAEQSMIDWKLGLMDVRKEIAKTGGSLSRNTREGLNNRAVLITQITALKDFASAQAANGASAKRVARILRDGRDALIDTGAAAGISRPKIQKYMDSLVDIPGTVKTILSTPGAEESKNKIKDFDDAVRALNPFHNTRIDTPGLDPSRDGLQMLMADVNRVPDNKEVKTSAPGAKQAKRDIDDVSNAIGNMFGKTVGIDLSSNAKSIVEQVAGALSGVFNADGGVYDTVSFNANGDIKNGHEPQIVPRGRRQIRVFGEEETHGEGYVPFNPAKRGRSRMLTEQIVDRLGGGEVLWNADGNVYAKMKRPQLRKKHPNAIDADYGRFAKGLGERLSEEMNSVLERLSVGMHWPLPKRYGYSGSWGSYSSGGSHPALDFPAPRGTPIYAVLPGTVMHTTSLGDSYGNYTEISHGKGLSSLYAHQQRFNTKAGARVMSGETIGYVNSTGNSTGDHLHLEMQRGGNSFDYTSMLNKAGGLAIMGPAGQYEGSHEGLDRASPGTAQAYAQSIMPRYGWKPFQWQYWKDLGNRESGWRWNARNPSSGAYGIPQSLPAEKMASSGPDWAYNVGTQVDWMAGYVAGRYGGPFGAIQHHNANNWYGDGAILDRLGARVMDTGGRLRHGQVAVNLSGEDETMLNPASSRLIDDLVDALNHVTDDGRRRSNLIQPWNSNHPNRHRGGGRFAIPDLERRAERELRKAERDLERAKDRVRFYDKGVERAEKRLDEAKGAAEKAEAESRLRQAEQRLKDAEKRRDRAERDRDRAEEDRKTAKQDQKRLDRAFDRFEIKPGMDRAEVKSELSELMAVVKETLGKDSGLFKSLDRFRDRVQSLAKRIDEEREERRKLNEQLKQTVANQKEYASTVAGNFKNDPFSGGLDEMFLQLRADKNDAKRFDRLRGRSKRLGLDGPLAKALIASGNVDLLAELVRGGRDEIRKAEQAYESRGNVVGKLGQHSGQQFYGEAIRDMKHERRRSDHLIKKLDKTLDGVDKKIGNEVRKGSKEGVQQGMRDRIKDMNLRVREASR